MKTKPKISQKLFIKEEDTYYEVREIASLSIVHANIRTPKILYTQRICRDIYFFRKTDIESIEKLRDKVNRFFEERKFVNMLVDPNVDKKYFIVKFDDNSKISYYGKNLKQFKQDFIPENIVNQKKYIKE